MRVAEDEDDYTPDRSAVPDVEVPLAKDRAAFPDEPFPDEPS